MFEGQVKNRGSGAGFLLTGLAAILGALGLAACVDRDLTSGAVLLILSCGAFAVSTMLRRATTRSIAADLVATAWIFAMFAFIFAAERDWKAFAAAGVVAIGATVFRRAKESQRGG